MWVRTQLVARAYVQVRPCASTKKTIRKGQFATASFTLRGTSAKFSAVTAKHQGFAVTPNSSCEINRIYFASFVLEINLLVELLPLTTSTNKEQRGITLLHSGRERHNRHEDRISELYNTCHRTARQSFIQDFFLLYLHRFFAPHRNKFGEN